MKAISIRQPWAWLIAHGFKDIENRSRRTSYRGPILIHASQGMTQREYEDADAFLAYTAALKHIRLPEPGDLARGGIVGVADLHDCIPPELRASPWHIDGAHGLAMRDAQPLPFKPYKGQLGIFYVPDAILKEPA